MAYRRGWTVLSTLTLVFTTIYQWGWVAKFLDAGQLPLAIGIFTMFALVGYGVLAALDASRHERRRRERRTFEWTDAGAAAVLPVLFAVYLAALPRFRDHYALLFGWCS